MWLQGNYPCRLSSGFSPRSFIFPHSAVVFDAWFMPFPISTWLTTQSVQAIILMLVVAAVSTMICTPSSKQFEKQQLEAEQEKLPRISIIIGSWNRLYNSLTDP
jgi:PTS system cellobiose-specific IIC component